MSSIFFEFAFVFAFVHMLEADSKSAESALFLNKFLQVKSGRCLEGSLVLLILSKQSWKELQLKIRDVESHAFSPSDFVLCMGNDPILTPILNYCNSSIFTGDVPDMHKYEEN